MDPLSIFTIIQLTAQASLTLYEFIETLKDAKSEISALGRDLLGLTTVLQRLERTLTIPKNKAYLDTEADLRTVIDSWVGIVTLCHDKVKVLDSILKSCSYRESTEVKPKLSGVKWYFKRSEALEAQQQLVRTQVTLDNAMTQGVLAILLAQAGEDKPAPIPAASSSDLLAERSKEGGQLRGAARNGDRKAIAMLLEAEAPLNSRNRDGRTALSIAVEQGHLETVRFLLQQKDITVDSAQDIVQRGNVKVSESRRTPLHWAAACGHTAIAGLLLDAGAKMTAQTYSQRQPVQEAAIAGHHDTVAYLLKRGADVDTKTYYSWTMLHTAAAHGRLDLALLLLEHGANTEIAYTGTWHGEGRLEGRATHQTPLHYAVRPTRKPAGDETAMIMLLVQTGQARVGAKDNKGCTPLHYAVQSRWKPALRVLLDHAEQYQIQVKNGAGKTVLDDATSREDREMIDMISTKLQKG